MLKPPLSGISSGNVQPESIVSILLSISVEIFNFGRNYYEYTTRRISAKFQLECEGAHKTSTLPSAHHPRVLRWGAGYLFGRVAADGISHDITGIGGYCGVGPPYCRAGVAQAVLDPGGRPSTFNFQQI